MKLIRTSSLTRKGTKVAKSTGKRHKASSGKKRLADLGYLTLPKIKRIDWNSEEICDTIKRLALLGLSRDAICAFLDISPRDFKRKLKVYPHVKEALQEGQLLADGKVVNALYHKATGYTHPDEEIKVIDDKVVRVKTTKHYAPDTQAAIFILKNRHPDKWRDRVEHTGANGAPLHPEGMSDLEVARRVLFAMQMAQKADQGKLTDPAHNAKDITPQSDVQSDHTHDSEAAE